MCSIVGNVLYLWLGKKKKGTFLAFRTEFCGTPEQSSLKPMKLELSREYRNELNPLFSEQPNIKNLILKLIMLKEIQSRELHVVMLHVKQVYCLRVSFARILS